MNFATLALICAVALLGPVLSLQRRLPIPVVIGELVVGILLGATGFGWLHADDPTFKFLGDQVGFALVMFIAGSHVPLRSPGLRAGLRVGILRAALVGVLAVPVGLGIAAVFDTGHGWLYAVILASSSASIVMPSLEGMPLTAPPIIAMLAQLAIADAMCIVLLPLAITPSAAGGKAIGALVLIVVGLVIYLGLSWLERSGRRARVHHVSEERGLALELRTSLVLLFGMAALAQALGVSVMLAGFVSGLAVAGMGEPRRLARQLFGLTEGLFAPLFFVWLGASLDLRTVAGTPSLIVLGVVLGLAAALVHGAMRVTGQPWPVGVITCAQLGVPVAAATIGSAAGVLKPGEDASLLLGALVTIAITAAVSGRVSRVATAAPH